jgi:hypothetical protein
MKRSVKWFGLLAFVAIIALPVLALAQVPDPSDSSAFLSALLGAFKSGDKGVLAALAIAGVIYVLRKFSSKIPGLGAFFATSLGGATFAGIVVLLGGLAAALYSHQTITGAYLWALLLATWTAAGAWTWVRRMLALLSRIPTVGGLFGLILSILGGDPDSQVQAAADAAKTSVPPTTPGADVAAGLDPK